MTVIFDDKFSDQQNSALAKMDTHNCDLYERTTEIERNYCVYKFKPSKFFVYLHGIFISFRIVIIGHFKVTVSAKITVLQKNFTKMKFKKNKSNNSSEHLFTLCLHKNAATHTRTHTQPFNGLSCGTTKNAANDG